MKPYTVAYTLFMLRGTIYNALLYVTVESLSSIQSKLDFLKF